VSEPTKKDPPQSAAEILLAHAEECYRYYTDKEKSLCDFVFLASRFRGDEGVYRAIAEADNICVGVASCIQSAIWRLQIEVEKQKGGR